MLLNLDAGELDHETEDLWSLFDILNCACGGHAGDLASMTRIASFCASRARDSQSAQWSVRLGAHPSYPDRSHFGRESMAIEPNVLALAIAAQCGALAGVASAHTLRIESMKPHGALYHDANKSPALAAAVIRGAISGLGYNVTVIGPPTGALRDAAEQRGLTYLREGFADRRMHADGSLVSRREPDALLTNPVEAARQAKRLANEVDTICIHADTPGAKEIARAVREVFA